MLTSLKQLDELLRGRVTSPERISEGKINLSLRRFAILAVVLGATYGFFMGWYAIFSDNPDRIMSDRVMQVIASTIKLPLLFLATLVVTFPSLYVFNALVGCRLSFVSSLRLLVGAVVVNVTVAASLGPILGFFTVSTASYSFMVLLNVLLMGVAGLVALAFLLHTLRRLAYTPFAPVSPPPLDKTNALSALATSDQPTDLPPAKPELGPLDKAYDDMPEEAMGQAQTIFRVWLIIYALVGAQMGWVLRPFIGSPNMPFTWFRERQGNFFEAVSSQLQNLIGG